MTDALTFESLKSNRVANRESRSRKRNGENLPPELRQIYQRERDAITSDRDAIAQEAVGERERLEVEQISQGDQGRAALAEARNHLHTARAEAREAQDVYNHAARQANATDRNFRHRIARQTDVIRRNIDRELVEDFLSELTDMADETRSQLHTREKPSGERNRKTGEPITRPWTNSNAVREKLNRVQAAREEITKIAEGLVWLPHAELEARVNDIRRKLAGMRTGPILPAEPNGWPAAKPNLLKRIFKG